KKAQMEGRYYDPKKQVEVLRRRNRIDHEKLARDIDAFMSDLEKYVFRDVSNFLGNFKKKDLYLISYGHVKHQKAKIKGSGVRKYFKKVVISKDRKINIIKEVIRKDNFSPNESVILIDDRPEQLERAEKERKSVVTFHMCRPEGRYSDLICTAMDYEVKNLKEAAGIIKKEGMK
ncbi:MAG: hypothetical protein P4L58_02365, partial [Candidatus Pacebacteria bacterium]|nr:hypothetical protein [Candidatus Paceibacterota bacterium]